MTRWKTLHDEVVKARDDAKTDWQNALIRHVKRAVDHKVCDSVSPHRIKSIGPREIGITPFSDSTVTAVKKDVPAILLHNLPRLDDARLTFCILLQRDARRINRYRVTVEGTEKKTKRLWHARIDLDPEQRGQGPCGHPLLHAHVGVVTDGQGKDTRVPLPWLGPDEALAWILATLDPRLEPPKSAASPPPAS